MFDLVDFFRCFSSFFALWKSRDVLHWIELHIECCCWGGWLLLTRRRRDFHTICKGQHQGKTLKEKQEIGSGKQLFDSLLTGGRGTSSFFFRFFAASSPDKLSVNQGLFTQVWCTTSRTQTQCFEILTLIRLTINPKVQHYVRKCF